MKEKPVFKIVFDTTKRFEKSVVLVEVVRGYEIEIDEIFGDLDVTDAIKKILDKNELKIDAISEFTPNTGPGSFTGIKIGVTIANILNWALFKRPLNKLYKPYYGSEPNIQPKKSEKRL